jgi:protein-S-isoprenylcysteine O-methyltransferase Ste14
LADKLKAAEATREEPFDARRSFRQGKSHRPAPLILTGVLVLGFVLDLARSAKFMPRAVALAIGIFLAVRQMVRAKTAVDVRKPTTEIVTSGVFQFDRKTIYLSMVVLCLGRRRL